MLSEVGMNYQKQEQMTTYPRTLIAHPTFYPADFFPLSPSFTSPSYRPPPGLPDSTAGLPTGPLSGGDVTTSSGSPRRLGRLHGGLTLQGDHHRPLHGLGTQLQVTAEHRHSATPTGSSPVRTTDLRHHSDTRRELFSPLPSEADQAAQGTVYSSHPHGASPPPPTTDKFEWRPGLC